MKYLFILLYFSYSLVYSQDKTNLYIEFSPKMNITNTHDENIRLSFNLLSSDEEPSIYNFNIPNIGKNFENLTFEKIKDTISDRDLELISLKKLSSFINANSQHTFMVHNHVNKIAEAVRSFDNNNYNIENYLAFGWEGLFNLGITANIITTQDEITYTQLANIPLTDSNETECN